MRALARQAGSARSRSKTNHCQSFMKRKTGRRPRVTMKDSSWGTASAAAKALGLDASGSRGGKMILWRGHRTALRFLTDQRAVECLEKGEGFHEGEECSPTLTRGGRIWSPLGCKRPTQKSSPSKDSGRDPKRETYHQEKRKNCKSEAGS